MAKIIIEIDDTTSKILNKAYHSYTDIHDTLAYPLYRAVTEGIVIPNNATNGDVIKALFPNAENIRIDNGLPLNFILEFELHRNYKDWWNAPYKAGDTDGKICK